MDVTQELKSIFPSERIIFEKSDLYHYGKDWTHYFNINPRAVVFPVSSEEISHLVKWAKQRKIALVPSGGRTGLSGGACATNHEIVVSMEKMNQIIHFNSLEQTLLCQSGVITETIQKKAESLGLYYPIDFAARGSSTIGGNVATNAGGIRVIRYGLTRNWITSLTVVTGQGDIIKLGRNLIKNATGPNFLHHFIGSEGIFGIISEVEVQLTLPPPPLKTLLLQVQDLNHIMECYRIFKSYHVLQAFEFFSANALDLVLKAKNTHSPFHVKSSFYVLIDVECPHDQDIEKVYQTFEEILEKNLIIDGLWAQSSEQSRIFWSYRENISESLNPFFPYKNDISVRVSKVVPFLTDVESLIKTRYPQWQIVWFGHIGDGNLHINILKPDHMNKETFFQECQKVDRWLYEVVQKYEGSISAEHGVGLIKKPYLSFTKTHKEIELIRLLKQWYDPDGIMNPQKII